jgi:hypothetical protein
MSDTDFSILDVLDLPDLEGEVVIQLARHGPADVTTLATALDQEPVDIQDALDALAAKGRVRVSDNGLADVALGRVGSRTTLPAQMWPALLATDRLYSEQEIATLRTAVPILQFARAKMSEFADHGPSHVLRVKSFATQLGYVLGLSPAEQHLLRAGALFHDVGNVVERDRHHIISQETVEKLAASGELPFSSTEATLVGLICRWHRKEYDPERSDDLDGETVRTGLLASIMRVADAMDIDHRRSDYTDQFRRVLEFFYPHKLPYWTSLEEILGVRIYCNPAVNLQVFTRGRLAENIQIDMLRNDLGTTPLDWSVQEVSVDNAPSGGQTGSSGPTDGRGQLALLAFPFDLHSLVMVALSRKNLLAAGYEVELLCYPDTADGPAWLWGKALAETNPDDFVRLVVVDDRPDSSTNAALLETIERWRSAEVTISVLNRHEANWSRLPDLRQYDVEVVLGGDWAYFWGDPRSQTDLAWGRIAALCTRDPTQSTVGLSAEEQAVTQGLLKAVYDAADQTARDVAGWSALAEPILDRIAADDRAYFAGQAGDFAATYAAAIAPGRLDGRVIVFDQPPGEFPQAYYWVLESAIERRGRTPEQGIRFNVPYAIASWSEGNVAEILAISHWREEDAVPIRLLYPTDLGPPPTGNESTIRVRLPAAQVETVIQAVVNACNRS